MYLSFFLLQQSQSPSNPIALFAPYVLIAVVFYFLLFMPMQRQKKRQQQMLGALKSGRYGGHVRRNYGYRYGRGW